MDTFYSSYSTHSITFISPNYAEKIALQYRLFTVICFIDIKMVAIVKTFFRGKSNESPK